MARFDTSGIDELMATLEKLGKFDEIAPEMMEAGIDELEKEVIQEASKHKDTGEMVASIKRTGLQESKGGGYYMCTRPTGYASGKKWKNARKGKGEGTGRRRVRNMEKLVWLEYGVKGRAATPVITKAVINAEDKTLDAMRKVFEEKVSEIANG